MAAIDALSISLSTLPSPLTTTNQASLAVTANTTNSGSAADADRVEFLLNYSPRGQNTASAGSVGNGLLVPVKNVALTANSGSTGKFVNTFNASDFAKPGTYTVTVRAMYISGGVVKTMLNQTSVEFYVVDTNQDDSNNVLTDLEKQGLDQVAGPWFQTTLTGARIKQLVADPTQQTGKVSLASIIGGSVLAGGVIKPSATFGVTGAVAKLGSGANANNVIATAAIDASTEVDVAASFVPIRVAANDTLSLLIDANTGNSINSLSNTATITVAWAVVNPVNINL